MSAPLWGGRSWCTAGKIIPCGVGTYNPSVKQNSSLACTACPLHTTTLASGASSISDCVCDASQQKYPLPDTLDQCAHGAACCGCNSSYFYSVAVQACVECATGTSSLPGSDECYMCSPDFYLLDLNARPSSDNCLACAPGMSCGVGATVENITLLPGWWRLSNKTTDLRKCERSGEGSSAVSNGAVNNGTESSELSGGVSGCVGGASVGQCMAKYQTGPECRICQGTTMEGAREYYDSGVCVECPPTAPRVWAALGIVVALLLVLGLSGALLIFPSYAPPSLRPIAVAASNFARGIFRKGKSLGMQPKIKVAVAFYQVFKIPP